MSAHWDLACRERHELISAFLAPLAAADKRILARLERPLRQQHGLLTVIEFRRGARTERRVYGVSPLGIGR